MLRKTLIIRRKSESFFLRSWNFDDAKAIVKYADNIKIWQNLRDAFPNPYKISDAKNFISRAMDENTPVFAIAHENEAIGSIGLMPGKDVHRFSAELGYWLGEPFWGMGIITEAVKVITDYAFTELNLKRVFAEPYISNKASARVLEKAGYKLEGTLKSSAFKNGNFVDQYLYSSISPFDNL